MMTFRLERREDCPATIQEHRELRDEIARLRAENEKLVAACAACVPTTYLDPLLSGPDKVGGLQSGPPLEDLLRRIKERILALTNGQPDSGKNGA